MKRFSLFLLLGGLVFNSSFSQTLYFKIMPGYGIATQKTILDVDWGTTKRTNLYGGFGPGMMFQLGGGYMFSDNFGAELMLGYQLAKKFEIKTTWSTSKYGGNMISVIPSLVYCANTDKSIQPFGTIGLLTGIPKVTYAYTDTSEVTFKGSLPFGVSTTFGARIAINDYVVLAPNLYFQSLQFIPTKRIEADGTEYKMLNEVAVPVPSGQDLIHHIFPFGSLGVNIALILRLSE